MLAAVTLFASCSQEEIVTKTDGESLVSFTVTTPELGSRAASVDGDGTQITDLYYAVYDETSNGIVTAISKIDEETPEAITVGTAKKIELPLLNGHKYSLIFWAENEACPYTVDWEKKTIKLEDAASLKSNQENYDAFYAYVAPFVVTGHKSETIHLKRPFAQLNIATSQGDLERVVKYYGLKPITQTQVVVKTPTVMDLVTGNTSNEQELTYALNDFSSTLSTLAPAANLFPAVIDAAKDKGYVAISLNYLLVSADKSLVDIKMSCNSGKELDKEFKNVPVQRNYRTNIYGNIYTSLRDWTVEIKPEFDGGYNPAEQLAAVFEKGGDVTLYTDVELEKFLTLGEGKNVTINLNGNTITGPITGTTEKPTSYLFYVDGGTLEIKGEGKIETKQAYYSIPVWVNEGTVNIYGGEFYNAGDGCDLIYASGNGIVNIYGGYFRATDKVVNGEPGTANTNTALNLHDGSRTTAKINVFGGSFYKFNPANNLSEGANTNFVAEGYTSVQVGDNFVVVEGTPAATAEEFVTALNKGGVVTLVGDVTTAATASLKAGSTLDGGNNTLFVGGEFKDYYASSTLRFIQTSGDATIQNMTIDGNNAAYEFDGDNDGDIDNYGIRGIFLTGAGTVTIDNVTIKNVTYCLNDDAAEKTLNVSNSTFEGWTSYNPKTTANFKKTNFKKGTYGTLRPYAATTFENCDFAEGFVVDVYHFSKDKEGNIIPEKEYQPTIVFKNCTYAGQPLTGKDSKLFETADAVKMDKVTIK